jgi:branched-chain amino acid transport system substrate-binding protein
MTERVTKGRRGEGLKRLKRIGIAIGALTLAAVLWFTVGPAAPVEEKQVVKIGYIAPLTGGPSAIMQYGWRKTVDYLSYFEEVGVPGMELPPGVTIELAWGDSGYEETRAISIYERMRHNVVFFSLPASVESNALKSRLERDGIAAMTMDAGEHVMYPAGQFFSVFCTESERFAGFCDWLMENWEGERPPRVVIMGPDYPMVRAVEEYGTPYAKSIGIEMLPTELIPYLPLDSTPQLLRVRERGADYVYIETIWSSVIPIMKDAERLGLLDEIRFSAGIEDNVALPLLEGLGPAAEGYLGAKCFPWYEETPILWDMLRQYDGRLDTSGGAASTLLYVPVQIEAIRIAIEEVGYENLDGRAVKEAFYSIKDFDPHHIGRPVTYTREDHRGAPELRIYEVQGGEVVPITEWRAAHMLVPEK